MYLVKAMNLKLQTDSLLVMIKYNDQAFSYITTFYY